MKNQNNHDTRDIVREYNIQMFSDLSNWSERVLGDDIIKRKRSDNEGKDVPHGGNIKMMDNGTSKEITT